MIKISISHQSGHERRSHVAPKQTKVGIYSFGKTHKRNSFFEVSDFWGPTQSSERRLREDWDRMNSKEMIQVGSPATKKYPLISPLATCNHHSFPLISKASVTKGNYENKQPSSYSWEELFFCFSPLNTKTMLIIINNKITTATRTASSTAQTVICGYSISLNKIYFTGVLFCCVTVIILVNDTRQIKFES